MQNSKTSELTKKEVDRGSSKCLTSFLNGEEELEKEINWITKTLKEKVEYISELTERKQTKSAE